MTITVAGYEPAAQAGRYLAAVRAFLDSNDPAYLDPFVGEAVTDVKGKRHVLRDPTERALPPRRRAGESFEQVYRIVA